ncbi:L,D-transpeptidase family protein [Rhizobium sp. TH2]|uniref:L,D-transpeptidase family protein n=1 Tax=Rhizobium sp. TH2 TaxID=2775403 RepID=UPI0021588B13|nr:L,D-transpeptidase family protein [Rhizobium sp. TH2]UVC10668.1 L,D-transpeptidase family protein [Rhizobium sp. TH2]
MLTRLAFSLALTASTVFGTAVLAADDTAPLQIFVSKDTQTLVVYDGDQVVTSTNVSTGKRGHTTPSGIFSIIEKKKMHHSNLYDDAPMPWMQRITWSGVALHEGKHVPDYPASHGCVRMPREFAKMLFPMTKRGFHVIISDRELMPQRITTADLFMPRFAQPEAELLSDAELRPTVTGDTEVEVASNDNLPKNGALAVAAMPKAEPPLKILITRVSERQKFADAQALLTRLGYYDGPHDGSIGKKTRDAVKAYQELHGQKPTGVMDQAFLLSIHKVMNRKPLTGWLSVRRNFKPIFDAAVDLDQPEVALGTHFYTSIRVNPAQNSAEWYATTLDNYIGDKAAKRLGITVPADALAPDAAETAFKRVTVPNELRAKIETMLGNGSSLTITDIGTESETGQGTDFITITKAAPKTEG